jgi:hypothetical protein
MNNPLKIKYKVRIGGSENYITHMIEVEADEWYNLAIKYRTKLCEQYAADSIEVSDCYIIEETPGFAATTLDSIRQREADKEAERLSQAWAQAKEFEPFRLALLALENCELTSSYRGTYSKTLVENIYNILTFAPSTGKTGDAYSFKNVPATPFSVRGVYLYNSGNSGWHLYSKDNGTYVWNHTYTTPYNLVKNINRERAIFKFLEMLRVRLVNGDACAEKAARVIDNYYKGKS